MTTPTSNDDTVLSPAGDRPARASSLEKLGEAQSACRPRRRVARVLGISPLSRQSRPWFDEVLGEIEVAERLRALSTSGPSWRVLHGVPVGSCCAEVDHVVVGPAGVFSLCVATDARLGESREQSDRVAELLGRALGAPVQVRPLIVLVGAASRPVAHLPDAVTVVAAANLVRHLRKEPVQLCLDDIRNLTRAALKPRTWPARAKDEPQARPLPPWFARVRAEVNRARRVRRFWAVGVVAVAVAAAFVVPALVQGSFG
ncbi:MAG: hypothetical protein JWP75_3553 [Frondihabitans sp.]|nr:hypothetical protein [Frondihabitans sp.]